jgi:2-keto-3-deoxy-L-rhamnonate aldolase RhmA
MTSNRLRELLDSGQPSIGTHIHSTWPCIVEILGHTGVFDYAEFVAEYAPFDLYALDNFCRAAELLNMSTMIKIDQEPRRFLAQRAIGAGFNSVLFADCRSIEDVRECVGAVRADAPEERGTYGAGMRRFTYRRYSGEFDYIQTLRDIVMVLMVEKRSVVEQLEEILSIEGIDMIQWGPSDYTMSIGRAGERGLPEVKATERRVIETALKMGVQPRAEIGSADQAKYYLDLGVRHFCIGTDVSILYRWWKTNGDELREVISDA